MTAPVPPRRGRPGGLRRLGLPALGVAMTVLAWQAAAWAFQPRPPVLPSPWRIAVSTCDNAHCLFDEALVTVLETLAGFAQGAAVGLLSAALLAVPPRLARATRPLVTARGVIPRVALAPLLAVWLGLQPQPHVALAALACFFPVLIAALAGLTSTPVELDELARSLRASGWQAFVKIRLPWAMPQVFVGLKRGMALAVIGAVLGQLVWPSGGLGSVITLAGQTESTPRAFAAILLVMVISVALYYMVVLVERLLLPWARENPAAGDA